jgi:hypothetical protein
VGDRADSAIGVTPPPPIGVRSSSPNPKNFDFSDLPPKEVISFKAEVFAMLR